MQHLGKPIGEWVASIFTNGTQLRKCFVTILKLVFMLWVIHGTDDGSASQLMAGQVEVSWDPNSESDLAGYKVYYGSSSRSYATAVDAGLVLHFTIENLEENTTYYFAVTAYDTAGNESHFSDEVSIVLGTTDTTPPTLISVETIDKNTVKAQFDEQVSKSAAENKANYSIEPNITIDRARLLSDHQTVLLMTSPHANRDEYILGVRDVADRATPPNVISPPISMSYSFQGGDQAPPNVTYVGIVDGSTVEIRFDEEISQASAEDISNFSIDQGVSVLSSSLDSDARGVRLQTSPHEDGVTYEITIGRIADRAVPSNVMPSSAAFLYTYHAVDNQPPLVRSVKLLDPNTLSLVFDERVTQASAEDISNYSINNAIEIRSAQLNDEAIEVIISTSTHEFDRVYTITIRDIVDVSSSANKMIADAVLQYNLPAPTTDTSPPIVTFVYIVDESTVEVRFDEPVLQASAENPANYEIDQDIAILNAILHADGRGVHLKTTPHEDGAGYKVTIRNITDLANVPNTMTDPATFSYQFIANDLQAPNVIAITPIDLTTIDVLFSERVNKESAQNALNYQISDGIQVVSVRLDGEEKNVTLTTTLHAYDYDYSLTVSNIVDASRNQNIMPSSRTLTYRIASGQGGSAQGFTVNGWSPSNYALDTLRVGSKYYIDRDFAISNFPKQLDGLLLLKTANRDRRNQSDLFLEFNLNHTSDIYVAYDNRREQVPDWLETNFVRTNNVIFVSGDSEWMEVWKARYSPGRIQMGGNMAEGVSQTTGLDMYFVLIEDLEKDVTQNPNSIPKIFDLHQNYPNPFNVSSFNPRTQIRYVLREEGHVVLKVYNMLGQAVRTLQDGVMPPGIHTLVWDGRNENLDPMPSGSYLYALEIREQLTNGEITLTTSVARETRVLTLLK